MQEVLTKTFIITDGERIVSGLKKTRTLVCSYLNPKVFDSEIEAEEFLEELKEEGVHPDIYNFYVESKYQSWHQ